jgi:hypothetical protein
MKKSANRDTLFLELGDPGNAQALPRPVCCGNASSGKWKRLEGIPFGSLTKD